MNVYALVRGRILAALQALQSRWRAARRARLCQRRGRAPARCRARRPCLQCRARARQGGEDEPTRHCRQARQKLEADADIDKIEVAGPGFLNLSFRPAFWHGVVAAILKAGAAYGRANLGRASGSTSSTSRPIPPGPFMSATGAAPCSAMRSAISCSLPATT